MTQVNVNSEYVSIEYIYFACWHVSVTLRGITEGENRVGGAEEILTFEEQKYWLGKKKKSWLGGERNTKFCGDRIEWCGVKVIDCAAMVFQLPILPADSLW